MHVRLDVLEERPEERTGFRHPNLGAWIAENRPRLQSAAMTILSAYCRAGRPAQNLTPYGSFEGWSALVRQAVVWVGMPDPCVTRIKLAESSDTTADTLAQLITAWAQYVPFGTGITIADMLNNLYPAQGQFFPHDDSAKAMRAALESMVGCPSGRIPTCRQISNRLKSFRRRVFNQVFLDIDASRYNRVGAVWRLCNA